MYVAFMVNFRDGALYSAGTSIHFLCLNDRSIAPYKSEGTSMPGFHDRLQGQSIGHEFSTVAILDD